MGRPRNRGRWIGGSSGWPWRARQPRTRETNEEQPGTRNDDADKVDFPKGLQALSRISRSIWAMTPHGSSRW